MGRPDTETNTGDTAECYIIWPYTEYSPTYACLSASVFQLEDTSSVGGPDFFLLIWLHKTHAQAGSCNASTDNVYVHANALSYMNDSERQLPLVQHGSRYIQL